jgi:NitT/TauT family transport system substrate-binding protein
MKLKAFVGTLAIAATLATTAAKAEDTLKVKLDFLPWGIHAALHLAKAKGWYKEAGLNVEITDGKGSGLTIQQVASGEVDIGQVQLNAVAVARSQGIPVKSIAGFVRRSDLGAIVPEDSNINSVKDLAGKKVAYVAATSLGALAEPFLLAGGVPRKDINLVNVDASSQMSIYLSGAVDSVLVNIPLGIPAAAGKRPSKGLLLADVGMNLPSYGLMTSDSTLKNKAELLKRFVPVAIRAWEYLYDGNASHIDEGVQAILSQRSDEKLDPDILKAQVAEYGKFLFTDATKGKRVGWQAEEDWAAAIPIMEKAGLIKPGFKPGDFYTNDFINPP